MDLYQQAVEKQKRVSVRDNVGTTYYMLNNDIRIEDIDRYLRDAKPAPKFSNYLMELIARKDMSYEEFGMLANIGRSTIYKIINGKQLPEQDMLLRMAFVLELSADETQQLLKAAHRAPLTSANPRDIVIIVGLRNQLMLDEIDSVLMEKKFDPLTPIDKRISDFLSLYMQDIPFDHFLKETHLDSPALINILREKGMNLKALDAIVDDLEKDNLLRIGFILHLRSNEVQRLMRIAHRAFLNSKDERDSLFMKGLDAELSLEEINAVLQAHGFELL